MGFFSWECCGCNKPVLNLYSMMPGYVWAADVVLLNADGTTLKGIYDGYGRVGDVDDDFNIADRPDVRWYHAQCYTGQTFAETKPARDDQRQGFFYDDALLLKIFGPQEVTHGR